MKKLKVIIGCEFSGTVRDEFTKLGHDAWSCDLLPSEKPGQHIQGNILSVLSGNAAKYWDLAIFHPPCTYLCNSGVRWLLIDKKRWKLMKEAALFFKSLLESPIPRIAVENPIMHKYAVEIIGRRQDQIIQPWQFGHGETKATGLWVKNLPLLIPTNIVSGREQRIHKLPPSKDRWKLRSLTYQGIAEAMAIQWSKECLNEQ